ncbi:phosphatase PAP2 family protein [Thiolapillus brandeum]|uniref:undecaprenyl-diphosphate phosphatase n=1 Tax=Thiolapillus brandeum TaxID=1076588 RepID=A0A7U6GGG8_9GAMM|nr:phosphatase PAP2 family protein [Thiolapillus brandeum]BAO43217.1 conserved hypothetical protein [Thiolapillus brandeum]
MTKSLPDNPWKCSSGIGKYWLMAMLLILALLLPAFMWSPGVPEDDGLLRLWWGLSLSASKYGLAGVALGFSLMLGLPVRRLFLLLLPILLIIGLGAWSNEHLIKPAVAQPRPDIEFLASDVAGPVLPEGSGVFYELPDKASRSQRLEAAWKKSPLSLPPLLRAHWTEETGFSFPSGHAFAATALAAWLSLWIMCGGSRLWLLAPVWGWMLAVCYSRIALGVHRPEDILAGALEGLLLVMFTGGLLFFRVQRRV